MFRTITATLALAALLATAACNDITGPVSGSNPPTVSGGGDRTPQQRESPDLRLPDEPGAGGGIGSGDVTGDVKTKRLGHSGGGNDRSMDDDPSAGSDPTADIHTGRGRGSRGNNGRTNP
jgi:hypothetical protein